MEKLPHNPECQLSGTKYCRLLNMRSCSACTIRKSEDMQDIMRDIDLYESLLPEGGVARLFESRECQFCKGPVKGKRRGYAILDMAHPEPRRVQKWLFGKRAVKIGTMIPVQMSVCGRCRARFLWLDYLPVLVPVLVGIGALFLFTADAVKQPLVNISMFMPFAGWIVSVLLGALIGRLLANALAKRWSRDMYVDALSHPVIAEMTGKGWTPITTKSRTKLLFSRSRLSRGLGTAEDPHDGEETI